MFKKKGEEWNKRTEKWKKNLCGKNPSISTHRHTKQKKKHRPWNSDWSRRNNKFFSQSTIFLMIQFSTITTRRKIHFRLDNQTWPTVSFFLSPTPILSFVSEARRSKSAFVKFLTLKTKTVKIMLERSKASLFTKPLLDFLPEVKLTMSSFSGFMPEVSKFFLPQRNYSFNEIIQLLIEQTVSFSNHKN